MRKNYRKIISLALALVMLSSLLVLPPATVSASGNWDKVLLLPIAKFDVNGQTLDRGVLSAVAANGVFISWRFFPEEATGYNATGLVGNNFAIYKNGVKIADVTNSTNYLDASGTVADEYIIVTVSQAGAQISRTEVFNPAPRITTGISAGAATAGAFTIPVQRPATGRVPNNLTGGTTNASAYNMDQIAVNFAPDGSPIFMVKWESGSPDVISQGFQAPVIWDAYTLEGKLLWRLDLGNNFRAGQHYGIAMAGNFDGGEGFQVMLKTAPGSRVMEVVDGVLTGNFSYIGQDFLGENPLKLTRVTRWDGTRNWQPTDDYRNFDGQTANGTRLSPNTIVSFMSDFFYYWQTHPEVTSALHGANLEIDEFANRKCSKEGCEGHGWWMYPPQVMLGMYPANYPERESGATATAGKHWNSYLTNLANTANTNVGQWNQTRWQLLKDLPTNPCDFKDVEITREIADALALFWRVVSRDTNGGDRYTGSGHVMDGAEFYTVIDGLTGVELDTIEYAVPRGTFRADGSYVPDIGLLWNDFTTNQPEPHNRVYRHNGGVAYLDGYDKNLSVVEQRGYYSRTTVTRYDWDGEKLTSNTFIDSGFEVLPNPFANGVGNRGGMVAHSNTHGGPGRKEVTFNPASPRDELRPAGLSGPELLRWLQLNGSITCQGNHSMAIYNLGIPGHEDRDQVLFGQAAYGVDDNGKGVVHWVGYEARWQGNTVNKNYNAIEKLGHGDSGFINYFHPSQEFPQVWTCLEGGWWDAVLLNARTGEVMHTDGQGTATTWGGQRDNGRAGAGFWRSIPGESGWQLRTRAANSSPRGTNAENGLRQWDGVRSSQQSLAPGQDFQIFWRPNLVTSPVNNSISTINAAGSSFGTGNPGGLGTTGNRVCGGSKNRPGYVGNVLGDYREQLVLGASDASSIRIYFNTEISTNKLAAFRTDTTYINNLERQKSCYGQPLSLGFYYGGDMNFGIYYNTIKKSVASVAMPQNVLYTPVTSDSVTISWDAVDGALGYNIYRRDSKTAELTKLVTTGGVSYVDLDVVRGTDYWYAVSAYNVIGEESPLTKEAFIMLANSDAIELNRFNPTTSAGFAINGSRIRLGDLTGDGRTEILMCNISNQGNYTTNSSVMYLLAAYNLEGELLWEFTLDPNWNGRPSGVTGSSADEPVQIVDIDGDGTNEVIAMMHPQANRGTNYAGAVFVVLDGATGTIKKDAAGNDMRLPLANLAVPGMTQANINQLTDCLVTADLEGRGANNHLIVKRRYNDTTAIEMLDENGLFVMRPLWRDIEGRSGQSQGGHYPLAVDLNGDGKDEIISNYSVFFGAAPDPGNANLRKTPTWSVPNYVVDKDGNPVYRPGTTTQLRATDHVDTIQVGDVIGDGGVYVVFGGGGAGISTFCYTWDGKFVWGNFGANEPQSLNLGAFRTDAAGMLAYGLDRRVRDRDTHAYDGMFLIGDTGETLYLEDNNYGGFGTIVIRVDNWNGDYMPLCLSLFRNGNWLQTATTVSGRANQLLVPVLDGQPVWVDPGADGRGYTDASLQGINGPMTNAQARANPEELILTDPCGVAGCIGHATPVPGTGRAQTAVARGQGRGLNPHLQINPTLYDGYTNPLFEVADNDGMRFMAMDMAGDSRTELVGFNDAGLIIIYYNNSHGDVGLAKDADDADTDGLSKADKLALMRSGLTGEPKQQTYFMANYSRYPTDRTFTDIEGRAPARAQAFNRQEFSVYISWTPMIGADTYTLYRDDVVVYNGPIVQGVLDTDYDTHVRTEYTVVAHAGGKDSMASLPLVLEAEECVITFVTGTDDVEAPDTQVLWAGEFATVPSPLTREGYYFLGWYEGDVRFDFNAPVRRNYTLEAKWDPVGDIVNPNPTKREIQIQYIPYGGVEFIDATPMVSGMRNTTLQFGFRTITPGYEIYDTDVIWTIQNTNLATVDANGLVTINGQAGMVTLNARDTQTNILHVIVIRVT